MSPTSQSRHFNLHWLGQSQTWLDKLDAFVPEDTTEAWHWHVSHHQLLTLAKRSEREVGLAILWFSVTESNEAVLLGALLPGERIALISGDKNEALRDFLQSKIKFRSVMGTEPELKKHGLLDGRRGEPDAERILERQTPWGKRLTTVSSRTKQISRTPLTTTRRANELDRPLINRWARLFAADTRNTAEATIAEAAEWMRRGRLLIFETDRPVAMAALSGEYIDATFGRSCRLSLIFVDPLYRGRGLGTEMMSAIENEARLESAQALVLFSDSENNRIQRFYSGLGFKPADDWIEILSPRTFTG